MNFVFLVKQPPKKQRLPLSVARVSMKNQKDREEQLLQERAILGRFGAYSSSSSMKVPERKPVEDRILKSMQGKGKKKKDGKKSHGKRKGGGGGGGGGGKRRH
ncbi:uncharacterized protein LOC121781519 [Salvia splendens]|uniref:uncharacterized protein LOC121781519 n=1 Tax=Salvia splendens TaxID=180675 RepID=UPI001C2787F8|nr:uncharacterized protein LOC121781519 [Salvia splendens]